MFVTHICSYGNQLIRYTHNWWHTALFYLEKLDCSPAMRIYDEHVWGRCKDNVQVRSHFFFVGGDDAEI